MCICSEIECAGDHTYRCIFMSRVFNIWRSWLVMDHFWISCFDLYIGCKVIHHYA